MCAMLSYIKPQTTCAATAREMSHSLEQKRSSDAVKGKILPLQTDATSEYRDIFAPGRSSGQPYRGLHRELRKRGSSEHMIHYRYTENLQTTQQGSKTCKDDELVKHMSNLPSFLQQVEKEKSVQEKALNFGVLDWKRLEKWKYNERMPAKCHRKTSSLSNNSLSMTSGPPKISSQLKKPVISHSLLPISSSLGKQSSSHISHFDSSPLRKQFPSQSSYLSSSQVKRQTEGIGESKGGKGIYIKDLQARSTAMDGQQGKLNQKAKSCGRDHTEINMNHGKGNDSVKKIVLEKEALALNRGKNGSSISSPKTINGQGGKSKMRFKDEVNLTPQHCTIEAQNIVLLVPNHFPKTSCSDTSQFAESKTLDEQLPEGYLTRFSDGFSPQELHSREFASGIPHSCPLSTSAIVNTKSGMEPPNLVNAEAMDSEFCMSADPDDMIVPTIKCEAKRSFSVDASKRMDADAIQKAGKGRHPSPNRRFSFSLGLGKMTRSFSFKESSAVTQLSSTSMSGPVRSELLSSMESYDKVKEAVSSRGRSSPLRRLLEPLLKYKGAQSAEIVQQPDRNLYVMPSKPVNPNGPIQDRKHEVSTFQALLQLSMKNGLPFFKLAADNSNSVLAATIKKLPSSGKGDCSLIYTFYSVHEIKKNSMSWISQGTKGKSCGLGYNLVAHMKISSSYLPLVNSEDTSQCVVRECVLYGVDIGQVDKKTPEILFNREIAAIVIKNTREKLKDEDLSDKGRSFKYREFARRVSGEDEKPNSAVVILPVGIHGLPNKGAPSPLINRWKSGGSCDCGGWDVGCKLQILANQERRSKITGPSMHSLAADRLDLFVQSGEQGSKPIFSLEPTSNGFYSVEFNASISLLEAFSVCVAFITSRKLSGILDVNDLSETAHLSEGVIGQDKVKSQTTLQVPVKYVTFPPSSPVGRI